MIVDPVRGTFDGDENSNGDTVGNEGMARRGRQGLRLRGLSGPPHHQEQRRQGWLYRCHPWRVTRGQQRPHRRTLFVMTKDEAQLLGIDEETRTRYVRYGEARANHSLAGARSWFEDHGDVGNGPAGPPAGADGRRASSRGTLAASSMIRKIIAVLSALEDGFIDEDGVCTDLPFGFFQGLRNSRRWIGYLVQDRMGLRAVRSIRAIR